MAAKKKNFFLVTGMKNLFFSCYTKDQPWTHFTVTWNGVVPRQGCGGRVVNDVIIICMVFFCFFCFILHLCWFFFCNVFLVECSSLNPYHLYYAYWATFQVPTEILPAVWSNSQTPIFKTELPKFSGENNFVDQANVLPDTNRLARLVWYKGQEYWMGPEIGFFYSLGTKNAMVEQNCGNTETVFQWSCPIFIHIFY